MGQTKPWQIVVVVAAGVVVLASLWFTFGRGGADERVTLARSIVMADVRNGDLFEFSISGGRAVMVPEAHPDSGDIVLFPVSKDEGGQWVISPRYREALDMIEAKIDAVDRRSGVVTVVNESPRRVR